ncbi:HK97 gp10 family phage protein [Streptomyces sp. NBC_00198]|nr:HK97 gp10 family phage protein [Streptomyces sp. NBC_00198]MCX5286202.1 HK97 gp10 family phage protein [Streptomyces sp. NBC_00198]
MTGLTQLNGQLAQLEAELQRATRLATAHAAHLAEAAIKQMLTTSSHPKGTPTPSAPGDPPSLVTGTLRRSIKVKGPVPAGFGRWLAEVGPTAVYGRVQELGGTAGRGSVLPPRPYVQPAFEQLVASGAIARSYHLAWRAALAH